MSMIHTALSGAAAAQAALSAASQNIANVMTPGYSRQGVVLSTLQPNPGEPHSAGSGVDVTAIRRFSDGYKNLQLWQAAQAQGALAASQPYFTQLEQVMGSAGSSLSAGMDKFFAALSAVSVDPGSAPLREQVLSEADALARRFNNMNRVFGAQLASVAEQRSATVAQVNAATQAIARLNAKVASADASGVNSSGLLDERDRQIDALAALVDVRVAAQPDGSLSVTLPGGQPLVVGDTAATMACEPKPDGSQKVTLVFAKESFTLASDRVGGQLGGLGRYEQDTLRPLARDVEALAGELASRVNGCLASGYDLSGQPGKPLFVFDPAAPDGMLRLAPLTARELGFSADASRPGDSAKLRQLIALKDQMVTLPGAGTATLADAYARLLSQLAVDSRQNRAELDTARVVRAEAEQNWKSTSGVNRDEEAINLVEYQKMYQANMKVIAVAGVLFDSTLAIL